MKLNAVCVTTSNLAKTVEFYTLLGFKFPEYKKDEQHLESIENKTQIKLMIDDDKLVQELIGERPFPSKHSSFAIEYDSAQEVNEIAEKLKVQGLR